MSSINTVAIVGGTHGNEFTGIYLVKHWQGQPEQVKRTSFTTELVFANERAHQENKRYCDQDLNRQFATAALADNALRSYEQSRAKALNQQLGPKADPRVDLVIDLHTTTSNMGPCLLLPQQGRFYSRLAGYVKMKMPEAIIFRDEDHKDRDEHHLLCTLGKLGVIVEVGPTPQSVLRQDVYQQSETMTQHILDFVELENRGETPQLPTEVEAYRYLESRTLPLNDAGQRLGMVHSRVQDSDFEPLHPGEPIFCLFDGTEIPYDGDSVVYPAFINEAAYYDNNLAMSLLERVTLSIPA